MKKNINSFKDLLLFEPKLFKDSRGYFFEYFNQKTFHSSVSKKYKIQFCQDNISYSKKNVLRGLHYQKKPYEQGKLISVLNGEILDIVVDLREESKTYGDYFSILLNDKNKKQFWIPRGFAHGFIVKSKFALVLYKVDNIYHKKSEVCIRWDDSTLNINWETNVKNIYLSKKDSKGIKFNEFN